MVPVWHLLEAKRGRDATFRTFWLDEASDSVEAMAVLEAARSHVTPTFLVLDASRKPVARFMGATSWWALDKALDGALDRAGKNPASR